MDMKNYKINIRTGSKVKTLFVVSNMFQKDIVKRLFPESWMTVLNGEYLTTTCLKFQVIPPGIGDIGSLVFVTALYPEEVKDLKESGEVKRWKRIYKI